MTSKAIAGFSRVSRVFRANLWLLAALAGNAAAAAGPDDDLTALWKDRTFQRQFAGTYAIAPDVEPRISPEEMALLEKVRPLMAKEQNKAYRMIEEKVKPDSSALLEFNLGSICFAQDQNDKAVQWYRRAVQKFPSFRRAHRNLGLAHVRNNSFTNAIASFTRVIELGGADAYLYGLLGISFASCQDYLAAEAAFRNALMLQPENAEWRMGLTRCALKQQKFEEAVALLDAMIQRQPEKPEFWLLQVSAYLGMKQNLKAAVNIECIDRMNKATGENLVLLGDLYLTEDLADLAARVYGLSMERPSPPTGARLVRCAEQLVSRGAFAHARALIARVRAAKDLSLGDEHRRNMARMEARAAMAEGADGPELLKALEEAVKLDPLDGDTLLLLGQYHARKGEPEKAIFHYERAAGVTSFEATAKMRHAQLLVGLGRFQDAIPLLRRAQEVKPREDVARYIEQIERLARSRK